MGAFMISVAIWIGLMNAPAFTLNLAAPEFNEAHRTGKLAIISCHGLTECHVDTSDLQAAINSVGNGGTVILDDVPIIAFKGPIDLTKVSHLLVDFGGGAGVDVGGDGPADRITGGHDARADYTQGR